VFILDIADAVVSDPNLSIDGVSARKVEEHSIEVSVSAGVSINGVFAALAGQGLEVTSMRNKTNRLEQLFLDKLDSN
jgi:ABC-2 type transport system ATP-binding protein